VYLLQTPDKRPKTSTAHNLLDPVTVDM